MSTTTGAWPDAPWVESAGTANGCRRRSRLPLLPGNTTTRHDLLRADTGIGSFWLARPPYYCARADTDGAG